MIGSATKWKSLTPGWLKDTLHAHRNLRDSKWTNLCVPQRVNPSGCDRIQMSVLVEPFSAGRILRLVLTPSFQEWPRFQLIPSQSCVQAGAPGHPAQVGKVCQGGHLCEKSWGWLQPLYQRNSRQNELSY